MVSWPCLCVPCFEPPPENVVVNLEDVELDPSGAGSSVGELLCPFVGHPKAVLEDHIDALPQQYQRVAVENVLQSLVELGAGVFDPQTGLPLIGTQRTPRPSASRRLASVDFP